MQKLCRDWWIGLMLLVGFDDFEEFGICKYALDITLVIAVV